jgi:superfamily I DNA/RNA helicase
MEPVTIFGPPGTGKTTTLINIVKDEIERGTPPDRIAFVSFSRKAAEEAKTRASEKLGLEGDQMPWFRTLHSLAFQCLGLTAKAVLRGSDYTELGRLLGLEFQANSSVRMEDGLLYSHGRSGDAYLGMIQRARVREITLEQEFSASSDWNLSYQQAKVVKQAIEDYKKVEDKSDFVDMIEDFIAQRDCPLFDVLIVDEAQDLSPLQWRMVHEVLQPNSKRVYFAGDDDQCIYSWMGVDVRRFLIASDEKRLLRQSYRIPTTVHEIADGLVKHLAVRQQKVWTPTDHTGTVVWHRDIMDVDLRTGEWLILARTNYIANRIANNLKEEGYLFWHEGRGSGWSISPNVLLGIEVWLRLCKNQYLSTMELKNFSKLLNKTVISKAGRKVLEKLDPELTYNLTDICEKCEMSVTPETPWHKVINVTDNERIYIEAVRRRGEKILTGTPRIKISTIHKAKGGEADNVALLLDSNRVFTEAPDQDPEIRTFYVGATRAKKALHIIESQSKYGFKL